MGLIVYIQIINMSKLIVPTRNTLNAINMVPKAEGPPDQSFIVA